MSNDEVVAVLGHELGHWALWHTLINLVITELNILLMLSVFAYFYRWELLYEVTDVLMSIHSRRCEFAADEYATKLGYGDRLISSLTKLGK
ncbi:hypothetical protein ANCDUO_20118, partial [Ancylostoma duodenale]